MHAAKTSTQPFAINADLRAMLAMTKPSIAVLVVITAIPSLIMASNGVPSATVLFATIAGIMFASMSAGAFNRIVEVDTDMLMARTQQRPVPSGRVSPRLGVWWASALGVLSFAILYQYTTPLAAWISIAANFYYVVIYTMWLKPRTVQNIVIGGAAGSVGPLIGWAAVSGGLAWPAWVLFAIIFFWTPPHFWSLAIKYKDDYSRAGIPMLPVVFGEHVTRQQIFAYSLTLLPLVLSLYVFGQAGLLYTVTATLATLYFIWMAFKLYRRPESQSAIGVFLFSCFYLLGVFVILALDRLLV